MYSGKEGMPAKAHKSSSKHDYYSTLIKRFNARWPAWVALIVVGLLYEALPPAYYWGPRGLMFGLVLVLTIPMIIFFWKGLKIMRYFGLAVNSLITIYMAGSVIRLVQAVLEGHIGPQHLLSSALVLWVTNILVFALWYWNLDAGGPVHREQNTGEHLTAFLFPQTQISLVGTNNLPTMITKWKPHFIDYLFLSFNTSTAFSPTDTPVLSRWAKCMSMVQAVISLMIIVMLAGRAINIISSATSYVVS